jgi:hypothetical protein
VFFTSDNEYVFIHACFDKLIGYTQGIHKPAALISDVQCANLLHFHSTLHQYPAAREIIIGGKRGKYNKVNILWRDPGPFNCYLAGFYRHRRGSFLSAIGKSSFLNAGSFLYPLIAGVHIFHKVTIGHHIWRHIHADTGNL